MNTTWCDYLLREQNSGNIIDRIKRDGLVEKIASRITPVKSVTYLGLSLPDYNSYVNTSTTTRVGHIATTVTTQKIKLTYIELSGVVEGSFSSTRIFRVINNVVSSPISDTQVPTSVTNTYPLLIPRDGAMTSVIKATKVFYFAKVITESVFELTVIEDLLNLPAEFVTKTEFAIEPANDSLKVFKRFLLSCFNATPLENTRKDRVSAGYASIVGCVVALILQSILLVYTILRSLGVVHEPPHVILYPLQIVPMVMVVIFFCISIWYIATPELGPQTSYSTLESSLLPVSLLGQFMVASAVISWISVPMYALGLVIVGLLAAARD